MPRRRQTRSSWVERSEQGDHSNEQTVRSWPCDRPKSRRHKNERDWGMRAIEGFARVTGRERASERASANEAPESHLSHTHVRFITAHARTTTPAGHVESSLQMTNISKAQLGADTIPMHHVFHRGSKQARRPNLQSAFICFLLCVRERIP